MTDIFISYSTKDKEIATKVCDYLESHEITCWIAPRNIEPGTEYAAEIIKGIEGCKVFLLIYSEHSNQSQHVLREVGRAVNRNASILVYAISRVKPTKSMEYFLESVQWFNAYKLATNHFDSLLVAAKALLDPPNDPINTNTTNALNTHPTHEFTSKSKLSYFIGGIGILVAIIAVIFAINNNKPTETYIASNEPSNYTNPSAAPSNANNLLPAPGTEEADTNPTIVPDLITSSPLPENTSNTSGNIPQGPKNPATIPSSNIQDTPHMTHNNSAPTSNSTQSLSDVLSVGSHIQFGTYYPTNYSDSYNDSRINWIVLNIDKSTGEALCLTDNIIDIKLYDAAESGQRSYDKTGNRYQTADHDSYTPTQMAEFTGNSDWATSNIRTWLNSGAAKVTYKDQPPTNDASELYENDYANQQGFLYNFSDREKSLISTRSNTTPANKLGSGSKTTEDKVFLLSQSEVNEYLVNQNLVIYAKPTLSAIANDGTGIASSNKEMGYPNFKWVLRTPNTNSATEIMVVGDGGYDDSDFFYQNAAYSCLGIRPAIVLNLKDVDFTGDGTINSPYTIK